MQRVLLSTIAAILVWCGSWTLAANPDDATPAPGSFTAEIEKTVAAYKTRERLFYDELRLVKQDKAKVSKANDEYREDVGVLIKAYIESLKRHESDPAFLDGVVALVADLSYPLPDEIKAIVMDRFIKDPRMGRMCAELGSRGSETWSKEILEALLARSPDRETRGRAALALGEYYRYAILPWGLKKPADEADAAIAKAREFYSLVALDYADVRGADEKRTLGQTAALQLTRLDNLPNLKVGKLAPEIVGKDLDGKKLRLSEHRGKVVVLVFWGSWCGPCMRMVPHERELFQKYQNKSFALIGVNSGDDLEKAQETVEKNEMSWRHWWDEGGTRESPIQIAYNVQQWPTVYVIDKTGVIRHIDPSTKVLDEAIKTLLAEEK